MSPVSSAALITYRHSNKMIFFELFPGVSQRHAEPVVVAESTLDRLPTACQECRDVPTGSNETLFVEIVSFFLYKDLFVNL